MEQDTVQRPNQVPPQGDPQQMEPQERIIEPRKSLLEISMRELWGYRDLFYFLVWRDILIRYKQTLLGAAWALLQPLTAMIIFAVIFGRLARMPSEGLPYPVFAYSALLIWTFFSQSLTQSSNSMIMNEKLVTKIYFPRLIMPVAAVVSYIPDFLIGCCLLAVLLPYYGLGLSANLWALPIVLALAMMTAVGAGLWTAALNVKYRDFRYIIPFMTQIWMFASPVVYPTSIIPAEWRLLYACEPHGGSN